MNNISHIHSCYGCAVCAIACPKKIIDVRLNSNGFYEPYITDGAKCVNCGLCLEVCSYNHSEIALNELPKVSYGAWSKEKSVRHICASGGVGFEIGRYLIGKGYKAIGVKYDVKRAKAEHYVASSVDEFILSMGSKYIQSYTFARVAEGQIKTKIKYPMGWSFVIFFAKLQSVSMKQLVFFSRIIGKFNKIFK